MARDLPLIILSKNHDKRPKNERARAIRSRSCLSHPLCLAHHRRKRHSPLHLRRALRREQRRVASWLQRISELISAFILCRIGRLWLMGRPTERERVCCAVLERLECRSSINTEYSSNRSRQMGDIVRSSGYVNIAMI